MREFADLARKALHESGYSVSAAARALHYDLAYLSRVLNAKQRPSARLAAALDDLVEANGELAARVVADSESAMVGERQGCDGDIAHMKSSADSFLSHADKYGADTVASAAVQVWRSAQQKLDNGSIPDREQSLYLSAVAESAQVAGWLLFDAGGEAPLGPHSWNRTYWQIAPAIARKNGLHLTCWPCLTLKSHSRAKRYVLPSRCPRNEYHRGLRLQHGCGGAAPSH